MDPVLTAGAEDSAAALRMENELLQFENSHLAARLATTNTRWERLLARESGQHKDLQARFDVLAQADVELREELALRDATISRLRDRLDAKQDRLVRERRRRRIAVRQRRRARSDLKHLLSALDGSVVGPVLRRRAGFRRLVDTYGPLA